MKKRIIALALCLSAFSQASLAASDDEAKKLADEFQQTTIDGSMTDSELTGDQIPASEKFNLDVGMLSEKQIKNSGQIFTKIDLKPYANRDVKDEVEGDNKGGWSDQGENDLRMFDKFGNQEMLGVPFYFINPSENGGNAVLGLRGQQDTGLPTSVTIPVERTAAGAYFIQASPYCSGVCGTYTWVYEDGSEAYMDIVQNEHICDFWGSKSFDYVRTAWTATKSDGSLRSLYLFAMNNPYPEKKIKSLRLETEGGGAYIMIMAITLTDKGPYLTRTSSAESVTTSTYGWYNYELPDENKVKGSAIDFSGYLDAPAGKHGAVKADGERLVFEDGTEARFWGADITGEACFPDADSAEKAADRIARCGINLVRFAGFDGALLTGGDSVTPDAEKMNRLCFFTAKLKEKGIYSYFSLLSDRSLKEGDGIDNYEDFAAGYGMDAFFDDDLIELQKKFAKSFFGFESEHMGGALGADNSVVAAELVDSFSVFDYSGGYGRTAFANKEQYEKAKLKFNEFLGDKYNTTAALDGSWTNAYDRNDYETIEDKTIELKPCFENPLVSDACKADMGEFFGKILDEYYIQLKSAVQGYGMLVTVNSNHPDKGTAADVMKNADTDFVIRTGFNAKPYGDGYRINENSVFDKDKYGSMIRTGNNMISALAKNAPAGKPYIVNWASAMPNLYFSEASVMMAAFAGQKGWSAVQHSFANGEYCEKNYIDDFYSIYNNPVRLALAPVAASIFYQGAAEKSRTVQVISIDAYSRTDGIASFTNDMAFKNNTRVCFGEASDFKGKTSPFKRIRTDNIFWDSDLGLFEVRGDKTEAVAGFITEPEVLPSFIISADNSFAVVALTALDDNVVKSSEHYLLTAVCGNQNYKSRVNLMRNKYDSPGEEQIVVEAITGEFTLKRTGDFIVYPLTSSGERKNPLSTSKNKNGYTTFILSADSEAVQYEIIRK